MFAPFGLDWAGGAAGLAAAQLTYWKLQLQDGGANGAEKTRLAFGPQPARLIGLDRGDAFLDFWVAQKPGRDPLGPVRRQRIELAEERFLRRGPDPCLDEQCRGIASASNSSRRDRRAMSAVEIRFASQMPMKGRNRFNSADSITKTAFCPVKSIIRRRMWPCAT